MDREDVLTKRWLHKVMVFFNQPAQWPDWAMPIFLLVQAAPLVLVWWLVGRDLTQALIAGGVHTAFIVGDMFLFWSLPRRGISYGPWKSQAVVLAQPRSLGTLLVALTGIWVAWPTTLLFIVVGQFIGTLLLLYGTTIEPFRLRLTHLEVAVPGWEPDARPVRLLHVSDLHVERFSSRENELLKILHETQPDAILITGDYVNLSYNRDPLTHAHVRRLLSQFEAPLGVYAVLGSPPVDVSEHVPEILAGLPLCLMRHDCEMLALGDGQRLAVLGMDCTHDIPYDAARLEELVGQAPAGVPRILLYHSPELMPQAVDHTIDLYLCGHTHGGQVRLPGYGALLTSSALGKRYVMGHYHEGRTHLYISRGIGFEGLSAPRVRFLAPPETTLVTLRPA